MRIGINGFGKVGQALPQRLATTEEIEIVAINEIGLSVTEAAVLLGSSGSVSASGDLIFGHQTIKWLARPDHRQIGWDTYGVEVVVEASRLFLRSEMLEQSEDGQITILMTGDLRDELPDLTLVLGVNESVYHPGMTILCAGSDRTQALVPILHAIDERFVVRSYRACIHRPPYVGTCGQVQNRLSNAEQLARVLRTLKQRGEVTRVDDPEATFVTTWLDVSVDAVAAENRVRAAIQQLAVRLPDAVLCTERVPTPTGNTHSALVDSMSIKGETLRAEGRTEHHIWLKLYYDPVVSYAERIKEQLLFLSRHRGLLRSGTRPGSPPFGR